MAKSLTRLETPIRLLESGAGSIVRVMWRNANVADTTWLPAAGGAISSGGGFSVNWLASGGAWPISSRHADPNHYPPSRVDAIFRRDRWHGRGDLRFGRPV